MNKKFQNGRRNGNDLAPAIQHSDKYNLAEQQILLNEDVYSLCTDRNEIVRISLAKRGLMLGVLMNDPNVNVRVEVAKQASRETLLLMVNDPSELVRREVARRRILSPSLFINDSSRDVINEVLYDEQVARKYLYCDALYRIQIASTCNSVRVLSKIIADPCVHVREALAVRGFFHESFVRDPDSRVRMAMLKCPKVNRYSLSILASDKDEHVRALAALHVTHAKWLGEKLLYDRSYAVRVALASHCKDRKILNVLLHDRNPKVRAAAILNL